jgi:hypothetical protein
LNSNIQNNFEPAVKIPKIHNMTTHIGKRKRAESEESESSEIDAEEIFRRHFEKRFKPLPGVQKAAMPMEAVSEDEPSEESEWGGISEPAEESVEVIEHSDAQSRREAMPKEERKAFMVCSFPVETALC